MSRTTLAVFAIVAIAVMMGAASVAPAYAAKLEVNRTDVMEMEPYLFPAEVCGVLPVVMLQTTITKVYIWDTGKVKLEQKTYFTFEDLDDNIVGQGFGKLNEITKVDKLPKDISQENNRFKCTNGASDPEFEGQNNFGQITTVDKDGNITSHSYGS